MSIFEIPKYFWEKKIVKIDGKDVTIKKLKVSLLKKVFKLCDDKFFSQNYMLF
jgi:hypothetical protein